VAKTSQARSRPPLPFGGCPRRAGPAPERSALPLRKSGTSLARVFAMDVAGLLVAAPALKGRVADVAAVGPLDERDLDHQAGLHPVRASGLGRRRQVEIERARGGRELLALGQQLFLDALKAGADLARVDQAPVAVVVAEQQRAQ